MAARALVVALTMIGGVFATVAPRHSSSPQRQSRSSSPRRAALAPQQIPAPKLLGQRIMVGMQGTAADAGLLQRVRRGRVGAVILLAANIVDRAQLTALTGSLQTAAREGRNPPLLIAVDQEGGQVKRLTTDRRTFRRRRSRAPEAPRLQTAKATRRAAI